MNTTKPCILILNYNSIEVLQSFVQKASNLCEHIFLADFEGVDIPKNYPLALVPTTQKGQAILDTLTQAKAHFCTHIITLDIDCDQTTDLEQLIKNINNQNLTIFTGVRDFNKPKTTLFTRIERKASEFWLRVQTSLKLQDIHSNTRAYPIKVFDFIKLREKAYAFDSEILVRAAWAGFSIVEIPIKNKVSRNKTNFYDHLHMVKLNTHFTMRALVPLPFKRFDRDSQAPISLKRPILALRQLMNDPYNRATPWQLARTAGLSMAILTVPAPIIQSIFLLFSIGWLKLNRLCAIAMIPLTWPPLLPAIAILVGYRVRHGEWLKEFSIQTLGYEVGERALEWVIGSLVLTPILGLALGLMVGLSAWCVNKK